MLSSIPRRLKGDRKYFTIVFFILFLVLLIGIITPVILDSKENSWEAELDSQIKKIENSVLQILRDKVSELLSDKNEIKKELGEVLHAPNTSYRELIKLVNDDKYTKYSVEVLAPNGRTIAWNEKVAIPQENIFPLAYPLGETFFYNSQLITYLSIVDTVTIEHDNFFLVFSSPVEKHYQLQNSYFEPVSLTERLNNNFLTQFEIFYHPFADKPKDGRKYSFDILNNGKNKIATVSFIKPSLSAQINSLESISENIQVIFLVLAYVVIAFGFRQDFRELKYKTLKFFVLLIYYSIFRALLYWLNFPSRFLDGMFVDPAYFSSAFAGGIVKSPIEFFLTTLFFFLISVYVFRNVQKSIQGNILWSKNLLLRISVIILFTITFFLSIRAVAATLKSVIFDSAIRYFKEPDIIPDIPSMTMNLIILLFGVASILFLCSFILIIINAYPGNTKDNKKKIFIKLFAAAVILGIIYLLIQNQPLITPLLMIIIVGFTFILTYHFYNKGPNVYNYIYATLTASLISIILLSHFNLQLERNSLRTLAYEINRPNDNLLKFHIEETLRAAAKDPKFISSFLKKNINNDAIAFLIWCNSSLQKESLHSSVSLYNRQMELEGSFSVGIDKPELGPMNFAEFTPTGLRMFRPLELLDEYEQAFTGIIQVKERGIIIGYVSVTVAYDLQMIGNRNIPAFVESGTNVLRPVVDVKELRIFEFLDSKVRRVFGDIYPSRDQVEPIWEVQYSQDNDAWLNLTLNDEEYLTYLTKSVKGSEESITALLLKEKQITWNLFNFFKLFVIHSLFILILFFVIFISRFKKINYTFRGQLLISFLIISIIPVVVLAIYNREVVRERTRTAVINELNERLNYLENHIIAQKEKHKERDLITIFSNAGKELGISFSAYENTEQVFNSRDQFYKSGFFSSKLNPQAYYHLNYLSYREYLTRESIENFYYDSFYKKISIDDKNIIIGVNDAFNRVDIIYSTMDMDVFLFGIYSLAVIIIIIISTFLANNISAPIRRLTKATISIAQGDLNVEIVNKEKGEIKDLVSGFNAMTKELQKNQFELAELERENAWKEMAKQVAHEIKNPLTPLKLAVQQLVATYKDKSDKFDSVFQKVTQTILTQIENLSSIATEFSRFAKMPSLKLEEIDLQLVIIDTFDLFVDEKVKLIFNSGVKSTLIEADMNQLRRMIINLIRNSIQADATEIKIDLNEQENNFVLFFSDNGKGITEANRDKIFEAGFTSKEKGMGIGLKLIKRFLEGINGNIILQDSSENGTTFKITIPKFNK